MTIGVRAPVAVALDAPDTETAQRWAAQVADVVMVIKIGLELFNAIGVSGVQRVRHAAPECQLFLDLKLHDIPNTVAGAARSIATLRPELLTVHALGGRAMIEAACATLPGTTITGVTVLTSMNQQDVRDVGLEGTPQQSVLRLAELAVESGAGALVCSPHEVAAVRAAVGPGIRLITPGVRPEGSDRGDQRRVTTPRQALADGADLLVIGRPITGASDVGAAASAIRDECLSPKVGSSGA